MYTRERARVCVVCSNIHTFKKIRIFYEYALSECRMDIFHYSLWTVFLLAYELKHEGKSQDDITNI